MVRISPEFCEYEPFRFTSDGTIIPAQVMYDGHLYRANPGRVKEILQKYGLKEGPNYYEREVDAWDVIIFHIRPEDLELMREMFAEIQKESAALYEKDMARQEKYSAACKVEQDKLNAILNELREQPHKE